MLWVLTLAINMCLERPCKSKGDGGFFISGGIKKLLNSLTLFRITESDDNFACGVLGGLLGKKPFFFFFKCEHNTL